MPIERPEPTLRSGEIRIGCQGAGLLYDEIDRRVFVSCTPQDIVRIVRLASDGTPSLVGDLDVGPRPDALTFAVRR